MTANYFDNQETIAKNLVLFMRLKGYSRLSLSKLTEIDRTSIEQILNAQNIDEFAYGLQIVKINQVFEFADDYLLTSTQTNSLQPTHIAYSERSELAQKMLDGLDDILDIYSMYIK